MATEQIFYQSAALVSSEKHRKTSVKTGENFSFASGANSVPLTAVEFGPAAADYPIVFAGQGDNVFPATVLGTQGEENLFVAEDGHWRGRYIPGYIRRYPFIFSTDAEQSRFTLLIDEAFEGVNSDDRGERLFDADGNQTQYLKGVLRFLEDYQARFMRTQAFCKRLVELDLLVPMQAQFTIRANEKRSLGGFMVVDRERLKGLKPDVLADMMARDELECIFLHLSSLRHFRDMVEKAHSAEDDQPQEEPETDEEAV